MKSELMITCDTDKLSYTTVGHPDAPPLLLIHSWLSYRGVWQQTMEAFKDSHYCVAIDLLGFGNSDKPAGADYSLATQGQRVYSSGSVSIQRVEALDDHTSIATG